MLNCFIFRKSFLRFATVTVLGATAASSFAYTVFSSTALFLLSYRLPHTKLVSVTVDPAGFLFQTGGSGNGPRGSQETHKNTPFTGGSVTLNTARGFVGSVGNLTATADSSTFLSLTFFNNKSLPIIIPFSFDWKITLYNISTQPNITMVYGGAQAGLILYDTSSGSGQNFIFQETDIASGGLGDPKFTQKDVKFSGDIAVDSKSSTTLFVTNFVSGRATSQPVPGPLAALGFLPAILRRRNRKS